MPTLAPSPRVPLFHSQSRARLRLTGLVLTVAAMAASDAIAQVKYQVVVPEVQGQPIAATQPRGNQINERGQTLLNRSTSFAIWDDDQPLRIVSARSAQYGSPVRVSATTINEKQQVVGSKTYVTYEDGVSASISRPFYWDAERGVVDLEEAIGPFAQCSVSLVDLNDQGWAVGAAQGLSSEGGAASTRAFLWHQDRGSVDIEPAFTLGDSAATFPQAINNGNAVVGIYHRFTSSTSSYYERGFLFADGETFSLEDVDPVFFSAFSHTARDINNRGQIVGERERFAYLYDTASGVGHTIKGFGRSADGTPAAARAYAINDLGLVAGMADSYRSDGVAEKVPLLWSAASGSINLYDYLSHSRQNFLPSGLSASECVIVPKSINRRGQVSAQLYSNSSQPSYSREIILQPTVALDWHEMRQTQEDGVTGVLYRYDKSLLPANSLPLELLNLEAAFSWSSDLQTWNELKDGSKGVRITQNSEVIELFVPLTEERLFVQIRLQETSAAAF